MYDIKRFKELTKLEMAFTSSKKHVPISNFSNQSIELPKISSSQLEKAAKNLPTWLRNNAAIKQLPAIYQGVLGQVQIAQYDYPGQAHVEFSNRLTDTERVYQLLLTSRLSHEILATIWAHVNQTFPGKLINKELCFALALIALFQRKNIKDPFSAIKSERVPPLPNLYPQLVDEDSDGNNKEPLIQFLDDSSNENSRPSEGTTNEKQNIHHHGNKSIVNQSNRPIKIATTNAFIHIEVPSIDNNFSKTSNILNIKSISTFANSSDILPINNDSSPLSSPSALSTKHCNTSNKTTTSILDLDCKQMQLDEELSIIASIWSRQMDALKSVFKRTFDVLNVQHGRNNSLESLRTDDGAKFIQNLARCYPIAHRIWIKVSEIKQDSNNRINNNYVHLIDNLMTSINESWAVLVNLFDEAGQGEFIEAIMDGLNYEKLSDRSMGTSEELKEGNGTKKNQSYIPQEKVCAICLTATGSTKHYTVTTDRIDVETSLSIAKYDANEDNLLTIDEHNYYHSSCGNFWLNQVEPTLPVAEHKIKSPIQPQRIHSTESDCPQN